jgi:shikimate 5-dehydrogenase
VNTIYKVHTSTGIEVWGDNTDFRGVKGLLTLNLGKDKPLIALVLGAGGTSRAVLYALNR